MNSRIFVLLLLFAGGAVQAEDPITVRSYFSKGFGRLFSAECTVLEIKPVKDGTKGGETRPIYFVAFKAGVEAKRENITKGIHLQFWTNEVKKQFEKAFRGDAARKIKLIGYETFQGEGEPTLAEKLPREGFINQGYGWQVQQYFEVRGIE